MKTTEEYKREIDRLSAAIMSQAVDYETEEQRVGKKYPDQCHMYEVTDGGVTYMHIHDNGVWKPRQKFSEPTIGDSQIILSYSSLIRLRDRLHSICAYDPLSCHNEQNLAYMQGRSELAREILKDYIGDTREKETN